MNLSKKITGASCEGIDACKCGIQTQILECTVMRLSVSRFYGFFVVVDWHILETALTTFFRHGRTYLYR